MRASRNYGNQQVGGLPQYDFTKPGAGCYSDFLSVAGVYKNAWFAIVATAAAVVSVTTQTIRTTNGTPTSLIATALVAGQAYRILTIGNTDFTAIGATANQVGTIFTATGAGSGTGTVEVEDQQVANIPIPAGATIFGSFSSIQLISGSVIAYRG